MLKSLLSLFGSQDTRDLKTRQSLVDKTNALESELASMTGDELAARTVEFRQAIENGKSLNDLLPAAFATVREAAKRTLGMRHYDVQLIGGSILNDGHIAEMRTGEGKTLVATLAAYLNGLTGKGVHVITTNDYLARRDCEQMGQIHRFLGLTVGCVTPELDDTARRSAYACDVTYATNSEVGFDYLRDNLKTSKADMVLRPFSCAIVDEIDSILIDEARTPLIISGPADGSVEDYIVTDRMIPLLNATDYDLDRKDRTVNLTDAGIEKIEAMLRNQGLLPTGGLYDPANLQLHHNVSTALRAHKLFKRDRDYVVQSGAVHIVDEHTGRALPGRRLSEGLHQAIEAKERVAVLPDTVTLASVTYQNLFRLYPKLCGMTGTAASERDEFDEIYGLNVLVVPTNRPIVRHDEDDEVFITRMDKLKALVAEIRIAHDRGQPVLIGTATIDGSEWLATRLEEEGFTRIPEGHLPAPGRSTFTVLNAKNHAQEADIIAAAGVPGAITIATNMAGRGTDIKLGGEHADEDLARKAREAGGLYVIGTERHESRRIDNQLRGRSGRQGDPGKSKFFLSFEDDLLRNFGSFNSLIERMELQPGEIVSHPLINKAVEKAQSKIEAKHFEIRKNLVRFDEVINAQRLAIIAERKRILDATDPGSSTIDMLEATLDRIFGRYIPEKSYPEQWDVAGLEQALGSELNLQLSIQSSVADDLLDAELLAQISSKAGDALSAAVADRDRTRSILLWTLDRSWQSQLTELEHLRHSVGLRAIGQRDPFAEFRTDAADMLDRMVDEWQARALHEILRPQVQLEAAE